MSEDVEFTHHTECAECGSSDAASVYTDGHVYCFSCGTHFSAGKAFELGMTEEEPEGGEARSMTKQNKGIIRGEVEALPKRGITEDTCRKWGYTRVEFNGQRGIHSANYKDDTGRIVAQKLRLPNKDMVWRGDVKAVSSLYGKWLWKEGGKKIVITEGEIDALTVSQLQDNKWPVVSVKDGAHGAKKSLKKELAYLNTFDQVILMFDMDDAGQDAIEECVTLFKPGKCSIAKLPYKDANECLLRGAGKEVINAIWQATEYRPDAIINPGEMWDSFINHIDEEGVPYPWEGLNVPTLGLRQCELVTLTAGSGIGKSSVCREIANWLINVQDQKVGYIALEEGWRKTMKELVGISLNKRLINESRPDFPAEQKTPVEEIKEAYDQLTNHRNLYLYNHFGSLASDRLLDHIRYMASALDVRYVVLDHLSIVISGDDSLTDERRGIDLAMTKLRSLVEETGIGMILVSHLKRPEGKGHEDGAPTSLSQLRGSAAIAQLSDMVIGLERNQQDVENQNRMQIRILKNRFTGETGPCAGLIYDGETGRLSNDDQFTVGGAEHGFEDEDDGESEY